MKMAYTATIDLSGVYRRLDSISSAVSTANSNIGIVNNNLERVRRQTMSEIDLIKKQLKEMDRQAKLTAAFQVAVTEVIRVRQELEANFGTHKKVREYMLGILQATDLGLITKSTISKCTEELMISAPKYWLAPALIALAAWIGDNKTLADRAVKEAFARDEEKTCLLFALITRRVNAGRIQAKGNSSDATFLWLNRYFSFQDPRKMKKSIIAYVDAYANGVFGFDKDNICRDHIDHWMQELIDADPNFAEQQKAYWLNFFNSKRMSKSDENYQALKMMSAQYDLIDNYVSRITAADDEAGIKHYFADIVNQEVDKVQLVKDIDEQLIKLVSNYEEDEMPLRDEEMRLQFVKDFKGDEAKADLKMKAIVYNRRADAPVDFASRLRESLTGNSEALSAKKTAIMLMGKYISGAFTEFMNAGKGDYPEVIDLAIVESGKCGNGLGIGFKWEGQTQNGENRDELAASLMKEYDDKKAATLAKVSDKKEEDLRAKMKKLKVACFFIIPAIICLPLYFKTKKEAEGAKSANAALRANITKYYDFNKQRSVENLDKALNARQDANAIVEAFSQEENGDSIKELA